MEDPNKGDPMHRRTATCLATIVLLVAAGGAAASASALPTPDDGAGAVAVSWQRIALRTVFTEGAKPPQTGILYLGFASLAVHDAALESLRRGANSSRAAVATAAHDVLSEYFPASRPNLDADLAATLALVADGPGEDKGVRIGREAAADLIASRVGDGRDDATVVYAKAPGVGVWQPAPGAAMATAWLGFVDPLVPVGTVTLDGPDDLGGSAYAADYEEVRRWGAVTSTDRTADQTGTAQFFAFNPPVMYRTAVCNLLDSAPMNLEQTTRLFAATDAAMGNAMIETFRLKFVVGYWRPFQAIAAAADDGNPDTEPQLGWAPLVANPAYSDYTSGHAAATAPFAEIMRRTFGDDTVLRLRNTALGVDRDYQSLTALEHDALNARVWGGLHFRDAMEDGYQLGHEIARLVARALR